MEKDRMEWRRHNAATLPAWLLNSRRKLHQFLKYASTVFAVPQMLGSFTDGRRDPEYPTFDVVNSLFQVALLRTPSINAVEGNLKEADFQKLIGQTPKQDVKAFSAEVITNVLDKIDLGGIRLGLEGIIWRAERNKVFREGSYGTLRCVAIDGWEPFASYDRHCPECLERKVDVKNSKTGEKEKRVQYFHRYVVAMLIGPVIDVVLGIEPVRKKEALEDTKGEAGHEGELPAALRLIDSLHATYGTFIDALVFDALYANGPLKEALALWGDQPPCHQVDDPEMKEHIDFWDVDDLETLETYKGKVRVIRAIVTAKDGTQKTWCFGVVGNRARKVGLRTALKIVRARWHIEDTGFNQWIQHWNLGHVYRHTANAIMAVLLLWSLVFNLVQFFVYRRIKRPRTPKDPTDTIRHIIEVMNRDLGTLPEPLPWIELLDTS